MLVANMDRLRIEASNASKGPEYSCPECMGKLTLKKGKIKIHHFAHKPPTSCAWAKGETQAHLKAKTLFKETFSRRELRAEVEFEVKVLNGDRRADVMVWSPSGRQFAIELQHSSISLDEIERRTWSYRKSGIPVIWVPFFRGNILSDTIEADSSGRNFVISRYSAKTWEKWIHGDNLGEIWFYDPKGEVIWKGKFEKCYIDVGYSSWYNEYGEEQSAGGFSKTSERWKKLLIEGPFSLDDVKIKPSSPGGVTAKFVL